MNDCPLKYLIGRPEALEQAQQVIDLLLETAQVQREQLSVLQDQYTTNSQYSLKPPLPAIRLATSQIKCCSK